MKQSLKKAVSCANADRVSEDRRLRTVVSDLARDEAQLRETYADLEAQTAQLAADHTAMLRSRRHVQAQLDAESEELAELRSVQTVLLDKVAAMQQEESRLRLKMQSRVAQLARVELGEDRPRAAPPRPDETLDIAAYDIRTLWETDDELDEVGALR